MAEDQTLLLTVEVDSHKAVADLDFLLDKVRQLEGSGLNNVWWALHGPVLVALVGAIMFALGYLVGRF